MPNLDFDAALAERRRERGSDPLSFVLGGRTFDCTPLIPLAVLLALAEAELAFGDPRKQWEGWRAFVRDVVVPEQRDDFDTAVEESGIDVRGLDDLATKLSEAYAGRPTDPPSNDSASGQSDGGEDSKAEPETTD